MRRLLLRSRRSRRMLCVWSSSNFRSTIRAPGTKRGSGKVALVLAQASGSYVVDGSKRARPPAQKLVAQARGAVIMQRRGASKELCRSRGCTLPEFRSTGFCANHAAAIDVVAAVDAELAPPIAVPDTKRERARARRKSA